MKINFSAAPPSWTYPQPVIQQAAPTGKESVGPGKQTGRTPPTTSTVLVQLEQETSHKAIHVFADTKNQLACSACISVFLLHCITFLNLVQRLIQRTTLPSPSSLLPPHQGYIPCPLTRHVHVSDGVQQTHIIVVAVLVEARVRDHLQRSVAFSQADVCDADCVHHHQPVSRIQHVVPARHTAGRVCVCVRVCLIKERPFKMKMQETIENFSCAICSSYFFWCFILTCGISHHAHVRKCRCLPPNANVFFLSSANSAWWETSIFSDASNWPQITKCLFFNSNFLSVPF